MFERVTARSRDRSIPTMTTEPDLKIVSPEDAEATEEMRIADVVNGENPDDATRQPAPAASTQAKRVNDRSSRPAARVT